MVKTLGSLSLSQDSTIPLGVTTKQYVDARASLGTLSGLLDSWRMNEGTGLTMYDSISGNPFTIGNVSYGTWGAVSGFPGSVFSWNGTGAATSANNALANFDGTAPFSVSIWVRPTSVTCTTGCGLIGDFNSTPKGWALWINSSGRLEFQIINAYPANALDTVAQSTILATNTLYNVIVTYDGSKSTAGVVVYINGVAATMSSQVNTLTASAANSSPLLLGQYIPATSSYLTGAMSYAAIYSTKLSSSQALALFSQGIPIGTATTTQMYTCGTTTTCTPVQLTSPRTVWGTVALTAGSATVSGMTAWSSTTSFVCSGTDQTGATPTAVKIVNTSATSITVSVTGSVTDTVSYTCVGN